VYISSVQNPRIRAIARLISSKRERDREGLIVVEGRDEIRLAMAAGHSPRLVIRAADDSAAQSAAIGGELITVSEPVFKKLSYRENPDGWLALFPAPRTSLDDLRLPPAPLLIVLESVEKPGNLGAIMRTADAAGVDAVLVCDQRTDIFSPNVIRASRGTVLSVPLAVTPSPAGIAMLRSRGIRIVAASPAATRLYADVNLTQPVAIAVGTEDEGLTRTWLDAADVAVRVPMTGKVNSLNVSVSAALIVYEAVRQRKP
jgi:TrmH family RNA methyltransferase